MINEQNLNGKILSTSELNLLFRQFYPEKDISFMQPSDHCINKTNKEACCCAETKGALFVYIKRATYKVR